VVPRPGSRVSNKVRPGRGGTLSILLFVRGPLQVGKASVGLDVRKQAPNSKRHSDILCTRRREHQQSRQATKAKNGRAGEGAGPVCRVCEGAGWSPRLLLLEVVWWWLGGNWGAASLTWSVGALFTAVARSTLHQPVGPLAATAVGPRTETSIAAPVPLGPRRRRKRGPWGLKNWMIMLSSGGSLISEFLIGGFGGVEGPPIQGLWGNIPVLVFWADAEQWGIPSSLVPRIGFY